MPGTGSNKRASVTDIPAIAQILITFGGLFLLGLLADLAGRHTPLPRVTLLLLAGFVIGPSVFDWLPAFTDEWFPLLTDIALAMIGAAIGYPVKLVMPDNVSSERKRIIEAYGASAIYSSGLEGSDGAILLCREIVAADPDAYFKPDQYFNDANPEAHFLTTGPEIWRQTDGKITHLVATLGTSGTVMGTGRDRKSQSRGVQSRAIEPVP